MFPRKSWGVLALTALLALPGYAQKSITLTGTSGGQGQTVTVPVNLSDGAGVAGSNFTLTFDANVLKNPSITGGALLSGHSTLSNVPTAGELRGLIYANPTAGLNTGAGTMANISFQVSPTANTGDTALAFTEGVLADNTGVVLTGTTTAGANVTVTGSSFPITESFDAGTAGWGFTDFGTFGFGSVSSGTETGRIRLTSTTNVKAFGNWQSPANFVPAIQGALFRARFNVSSTATDPNNTPAARLRVNSTTNEVAHYLNINSENGGRYSPGPAGLDYDLIFESPNSGRTGNEDAFSVSFDLINFSPTDPAVGDLALESIEITRADASSLVVNATPANFTFDAGAEGWTFLGLDLPASPPENAFGFSAATSGTSAGALTVSTTNNTNNVGFWFSPATVTLDATPKLYRSVINVQSDQATVADVPSIRLRINSSDNETGVEQWAISQDIGTAMPGTTARNYNTYFQSSAPGSGSSLSTALDVISFDTRVSATATFTINDAKVEELATPTFN